MGDLTREEEEKINKTSKEIQGILIDYMLKNKVDIKIFAVSFAMVYNSLLRSMLGMYRELMQEIARRN